MIGLNYNLLFTFSSSLILHHTFICVLDCVQLVPCVYIPIDTHIYTLLSFSSNKSGGKSLAVLSIKNSLVLIVCNRLYQLLCVLLHPHSFFHFCHTFICAHHVFSFVFDLEFGILIA